MAPLPITLSKGFISHCVSPVSGPRPQYIMHSLHSLDSVFSIDDFSISNKTVALSLRNTEIFKPGRCCKVKRYDCFGNGHKKLLPGKAILIEGYAGNRWTRQRLKAVSDKYTSEK